MLKVAGSSPVTRSRPRDRVAGAFSCAAPEAEVRPDLGFGGVR